MIKNDRFYVYGEHTILNPYKQKWKGRFYKKLHGDKCGWSFPIEFRAVIDNLLESQSEDTESQSSTKSSDTEPQSSIKSSDAEPQSSTKSSDTEPQSSTKSSDTESQSSIKSSDTESQPNIKSSDILFQEQESNIKEWDIDIPIEVYDFFKKYLN
jgi:hypothetical protein